MQAALRLARHQAHPLRRSARCLATTANPAHVVGSTASSSTAKATIIPLSNVEAQWAKLSSEEKLTVHEQLEELQKKDWKELSIDEKKAGAYSFGSYLYSSGVHAATVCSILRGFWTTRTPSSDKPTWRRPEDFPRDHGPMRGCSWCVPWNPFPW